MHPYRERVEWIEELTRRQRALGLTNMGLYRLAKAADPKGKGVNYLTIRRISNGEVPRLDILKKLEAGIKMEEDRQDAAAAA